MKVNVHRLDSIADDVDAMRHRLAARAHQLFRERGGEWGRALDDWLRAEREMVWAPPVELSERDNELCLEVAAAGVNGGTLDVRVTRDDVVISAPTHHEHACPQATIHVCEFKRGRLFRSVHLPRPVDPERVQATYQNGLLRLTMPVAPTVSQRVLVDCDDDRTPIDAEC